MADAGAAAAEVFYLHHMTPLNEVAAREYPETPVLGHVHGSELLMLERAAADPAPDWPHAERWVERICEWAGNCTRIVVNSSEGRKRAARLLDLDPERFVLVPNGFDREFAPHKVDRAAHWRRHLVSAPQGWRAGEQPGSVAYDNSDLEPLRGTTLLYSGRFTEVKRLTLLIEAYAEARDSFDEPRRWSCSAAFPASGRGSTRRRRSPGSASMTSSSPAGTSSASCRSSSTPAT